MAERVKTVLVNVGENRRIVSFSNTPSSTDAEALSKAIKETFGDILKSDQEFFIQVKNEAWSGVFLDVLDQEIVDKAVVNVVVIQKPVEEVSHCVFNTRKKSELCVGSLFQARESMPPPSTLGGRHDEATKLPPAAVLPSSAGQSVNKVQSHQFAILIRYNLCDVHYTGKSTNALAALWWCYGASCPLS
jgi:hypothetical protein